MPTLETRPWHGAGEVERLANKKEEERVSLLERIEVLAVEVPRLLLGGRQPVKSKMLSKLVKLWDTSLEDLELVAQEIVLHELSPQKKVIALAVTRPQ
jgi:hypothetical protein